MIQKIHISNRNHQNLAALLHTPKIPTDKIVIFSHGFKADKNYQPFVEKLASQLCDAGYTVLRFDYWGSGESDGKFEDSNIRMQIEDLKDVIKYAQSQGFSHICLNGHSLGSTNAIMAYDESIECLLFWSPIFQHLHLYENYKEEVLKNGYVIRSRKIAGETIKQGKGYEDEIIKCGKAFWQDFKDIQPADRLHVIQCPVLAIIGSNDSSISEETALSYLHKIPASTTLEVMPEGDHDFLLKSAEQKAIQLSVEFIKMYL